MRCTANRLVGQNYVTKVGPLAVRAIRTRLPGIEVLAKTRLRRVYARQLGAILGYG